MKQTFIHLLKLIRTCDPIFNTDKFLIIEKCFHINYNSLDWKDRCELLGKVVDISVKRGIVVYGLISEVSGIRVGLKSIPFSEEVLGQLSIEETPIENVCQEIKKFHLDTFKHELSKLM